jgi:hypothetical protein
LLLRKNQVKHVSYSIVYIHHARYICDGYKMKFKDKLQSLGFQSYTEYLQCEYWNAFKRTYFETHAKICFHCHSHRKIELHHLTYDRLGSERYEDVVVLCQYCHSLTHRLIKERRSHLYEAHLYLDTITATKKQKQRAELLKNKKHHKKFKKQKKKQKTN